MSNRCDLPQELAGIRRFLAPAWDSCEIRYRIRNAEAVRMIGLCDELPPGWVVGMTEPIPRENGGGFSLVFEVQGAPRESDGAIVLRILQRFGAL